MRHMMRLSTVLFATVASGTALAADKGATLELNLPLLNYSSTTTKTKPSGLSETKETTTATNTAAGSDGYMSVYVGSAVLTLWYPFNPSAQKVGAGWAFNELLEAGVTLGLNSKKEKESKVTDNTNAYGVYVEAKPKVGPVHLEVTLSGEATSSKGKESVTSATTSTQLLESYESTGTTVDFSTLAFVPLDSNLSYGAGLSYTTSSVKTEKPSTKKGKVTTDQFGVTIASLRLILN